MTFAMFLAENGIIPSDEWYHDKMMCNNKGETV